MAVKKKGEKAAPKAEKAAPKTAPKAAKEKAPKVAKDAKNGVTRPKAGTAVGKIWDFADKASTLPGKVASRADVLAKAEAAGINPATAATQYGKWRRYNGITGRTAAAAE